MATKAVGTRIDTELYRALLDEAKRRGQDRAQLLRTFIRDGLARYDSYSEQVIQTQVSILEHLKKLQEMTGATLHLDVQQIVLTLQQKPDETPEAYKERLRAAYKAEVFEALDKGARIANATAHTAVSQGSRQ